MLLENKNAIIYGGGGAVAPRLVSKMSRVARQIVRTDMLHGVHGGIKGVMIDPPFLPTTRSPIR